MSFARKEVMDGDVRSVARADGSAVLEDAGRSHRSRFFGKRRIRGMKGKLVLVLFLVAVCGITLLTAEGKQEPTTPAASADANLSAPGTFPIVKSPVTITIYKMTLGEKEKLDVNPFTVFYQQKTGVTIKWITSPGDRFKERMNLMFASGDTPDIIATGNNGATLISRLEESQLAADGLIIPVDGLIETQSVWLKQILKDRPEIRQSITSPNGKIYNVPGINSTVEVRKAGPLWINTTWLKNLGLNAPTTTDEYYNVLKAFKEKDANKNGDPNDEIPLGGWAGLQHGVIINSFGPFAATYLDAKAGVVKTAVNQPYYREALQYLRKLYQEGLMFPQTFTIPRAEFASINEKEGNGIAKIGSMTVGHTLQFASPDTGMNLQYEGYFLKGPNNRPYSQATMDISYGITSNSVIPAKSKYPEVAFRLLDWLYSEEGTLWTAVGPEGVAWKKTFPGAIGLDGSPAKYERITVTQDNPYFSNLSWTMAFGCNYDLKFNMSWAYPPDPYAKGSANYEKYLYYSAAKVNKLVDPNIQTVPNMYYAASDLRDISQVQTQVNDYINLTYAQFIRGELSLDNDWNTYLETLEKAGLSKWLALLQKTYDASAFKKK
jgi:putative aldouronate transport system substrate-binding protein